eukprot:g3474.t1
MLAVTIRRNVPVAKHARMMATTTFDGDMARLYMNFFNQAEPAWQLTEEIVLHAQKESEEPVKRILDVASGPGEPGLTLAKTFPDAQVIVTDGAEAMVELAKQRVEEQGLKNVSTAVMDLNDFSPVKENEKMDIVTAQFALMFTEDFAGSLGEVHSVLREGGLLVGTVWEEFHILPLLKATMTRVLGEEPPPPPINPLSLKDREVVDEGLLAAGFETFGRHNETAEIDINLGHIDNPDTVSTCLLPVNPSLAALADAGTHGDDVFAVAREAMIDAIHTHGMVNDDGQVVISTSTYRYFVARK